MPPESLENPVASLNALNEIVLFENGLLLFTLELVIHDDVIGILQIVACLLVLSLGIF